MKLFIPVQTPIFIPDDKGIIKQGAGSSKYTNDNNLSQSGVQYTRTPHWGDAEVPGSRKQTGDADPEIHKGDRLFEMHPKGRELSLPKTG